MDQDYKAKPSIRRLGRRLESMFWTLLLACAASAAARSCRGTWTKITRRSQVSEGFSEGFKACLGRCFWDAQLQLKLGHTEVHGPSLQGEATSPKASPKAPKHVLDVAYGTRTSAEARSYRGTWTKLTRRSDVFKGVSEGFKACFGRCFWHAQLQLKLVHTEVHGPRLQGEAKRAFESCVYIYIYTSC